MIRHVRLLPILTLISLILAVPASSENKTRAVSDKGTVQQHQVAPTALPMTPPAQSSVAPGTSGMTADASAPLYKLDWYSINGGGGIDASSATYKMGYSVGQPVTGDASSASYKVGIGFWHGAGGCNCPGQGDVLADGGIDVFDIIAVIGIAFSGNVDPQDSGCPATRGDANFDGGTDVFDLIYLIATAFSGGPGPIDPCA